MKPSRPSQIWLWSLALTLAIQGSAYNSSAQPVDWANCFDTPASAVAWSAGGTPQPLLSWDDALDACGATNSGSLGLVQHFTGTSNEALFLLGFFVDDSNNVVAVDSSPYSRVGFDLRVDSGSALSTLGDFGPLDVCVMPTNGVLQRVGSVRIPALATNWIRLGFQLPVALGPLWAVWLQMWPLGQCTNTLAFHVDNIGLEGCNCAPPPGLKMEYAAPGLHLIPPLNRAVDERQSIYTAVPSFSWMGAPGAVMYSMTISQFPSGDWPHDPGYQAHMFLVPQRDMPNGPADSHVDWSATNVVYLQIASLAGGGARAQFMFKTNQGSANAMFTNANPALGPVGLLASLDAASALGTWSMAFSANTNVSLRAPDGSTATFSLPSPAAALFRNPLHAYFGVAGNSLCNLGIEAIVSRIQITGATSTLDDSFLAPGLAPEVWGYAAAEPAGVFPVPAADWLWLEWVGSQRGYFLQTTTNLLTGSWQNSNLTTNFGVWGGWPRALLPPPGPGDSPAMFFRIIREPLKRCGQWYPTGS